MIKIEGCTKAGRTIVIVKNQHADRKVGKAS
jgi:hypothetical protein